MRVLEVMKSPAAICLPDTNLAEAAARMWQSNCGALPVISHAGELIGMITDRDICIALGTRNMRASDLTAGEVIWEDYIRTCKASDDVNEALATMRESKVRRLPVVDDEGRVVGILSTDDLVLRATPTAGKPGDELSFDDAVLTLQAIYSGGPRMRQQSAAA